MTTGTPPATGRTRWPVPPRALSVALLAAGLALVAVGTGSGFFFVADQPSPRVRFIIDRLGGTVEGPRRQRPFAGRDAAQLPGAVEAGLQVLLLVAAGLLLVAVVVSVVRGLLGVRRLLLAPSRGGRPAPAFDEGEGTADDATEPLRKRLARSLDVALPALDSEPEPREAVIACYVRMEQVLREVGTVRRPTETPTELLSRVLVEQSVPPTDAGRLTELFQLARFGRTPVDETMRADARRSLVLVRDALGAR